jgi:transposase
MVALHCPIHDIISYKATLVGLLTIKVDAGYTSQTRLMCGYVDSRILALPFTEWND